MIIRIILLLLALVCSPPVLAARAYFEMGLAELTVGFDATKNETTVRKWYLAAIGPDSLDEAAQRYARDAAEDALKAAAAAAYATPGEVGAKMSAAWTVWVQEFPRQLSIKGAAKSLAHQFTIGVTENIIIVPGLRLIVKSQNNQAKMYAELYQRLGIAAGGDVGKALKGYAEIDRGIGSATSLDIDIHAPQELTAGLARARELSPDVAAKRLAELAAKIRLEKIDVKIPPIVPLVMRPVKQVVEQIQASLQSFENEVSGVLSTLPDGEALKEMPQALGDAGKKIVEIASRAAPSIPSSPPSLSDGEKCAKGDRDACCRISTAACLVPKIDFIL